MSTNSVAAEGFKSSSILSQFFYDQNNSAEFTDPNSVSHEGEYNERSEIFSDLVLDYINQMLMEEDGDDKYVMLLGHPDLEATEKPFYDIIGEKYPLSPERPSLYSSLGPQGSDSGLNHDSNSSVANFFQPNSEFAEYQNLDFPPSYPSSFLGLPEDQFADLFFKNLPASEFKKGVEDAKKFLPSELKLDSNVGKTGQTVHNKPDQRARHQKNRHSDEFANEETRRSKQSAFSCEEPSVSPLIFDDVLLCAGDKFPKVVKALREKLYDEASKNFRNAGKLKESGIGRKSRSKKQSKAKEKDETDTNTLLLHCAQAIATGDFMRAQALLKQIRQHSSPHGDASQRVAHYFAQGLEARLAGTGTEVYRSIVSKRTTVCDVLKAYQLYLASCPFKKISYHFANQTILDSIQDCSRVHILDFGIYFGFQWPIFLKLLSCRPGGPPKLRITGIDIPQPGFRPTERIDETGRWLSDYAKRFDVPFEYHGIAAKFDDISIEELRIKEDETLVVNSLYRMHSPADETVLEDCPRNKVLGTIRKLVPAVFVNVILNGSYGAPFFLTRFREALYHFSALFDMLDTTTPRESERRMLVERNLYGGMLINAVSCEGVERERPETYKQWQVRCSRAGFELLPVCGEFVRKLKDGVRSIYHKDFNMDEDGRWLLIGWKGRILYALSAWKPCPF